MRNPSLLLAAALLAAPGAEAARRHASTQDIEAKVALETAVERRLQDVIGRLVGAEVVAVVDADLLADADRADVEVLPGVSVKETPGAPSAVDLPSSLVRRVSVTVFVDGAASDAQLELARRTAERIVALKPERGDRLTVEKADFRGAAAAAKAEPEAPAPGRPPLDPRLLLSAAWLAAFAAGLALLSRGFLSPLLKVLKEAAQNLRAAPAAPRPEAAAAPAAAPEPAAKAEPAAREADDSVRRRAPFSFVRPGDMPTLARLLGDAPPDTAAAVIHYLPPALASQALAALPVRSRAAAAARLARPVLLDPAQVKALEDSVLTRIDCMVGGEDKLAEILEESASPLQQELLAALRAGDPALGERLRGRVVALEDLARLDEAGLMALSRTVPVRSMAVALRSSPALKDAVVSKLRSGLGEWLTQEINLTGDVPEHQRDAELRRVVKALSDLVKEGKVSLRSVNGNG